MRVGFYDYFVWYSVRRDQLVLSDQWLREVTWMSNNGLLFTRGRKLPPTFIFVGRLDPAPKGEPK